MAAVTLAIRKGQWQVHREDCRDVDEDGGWDITDWADLVRQVFDGDEVTARAARIMPCVGPIAGQP